MYILNLISVIIFASTIIVWKTQGKKETYRITLIFTYHVIPSFLLSNLHSSLCPAPDRGCWYCKGLWEIPLRTEKINQSPALGLERSSTTL